MLENQIRQLWELHGPIDLWASEELAAKDIINHQDMLTPCRTWVSGRRKLKSTNTRKTTYRWKHDAEDAIGEWVPHSIFILACFLEGVTLKSAGKDGDVWVFFTNLGQPS